MLLTVFLWLLPRFWNNLVASAFLENSSCAKLMCAKYIDGSKRLLRNRAIGVLNCVRTSKQFDIALHYMCTIDSSRTNAPRSHRQVSYNNWGGSILWRVKLIHLKNQLDSDGTSLSIACHRVYPSERRESTHVQFSRSPMILNGEEWNGEEEEGSWMRRERMAGKLAHRAWTNRLYESC